MRGVVKAEVTHKEQNLLAAARPVNPEAQDLYLMGLFAMRDTASAEASEKAIKYLQQAIEKDPKYAKQSSARISRNRLRRVRENLAVGRENVCEAFQTERFRAFLHA